MRYGGIELGQGIHKKSGDNVAWGLEISFKLHKDYQLLVEMLFISSLVHINGILQF